MIRVNGMATGVVPAGDRGLAYGDGVFRTLAVRGGHPVSWQRQYAKLEADCRAIGLACPPSSLLREDVVAVAGRDGDAAVKIIVTRGEGERGYRIPPAARPNRIVTAAPLPSYPAAYSSEGIAAHVCRTRLGTQPALAGIKHLNRLENVLARSEWTGDEYGEGILCDALGSAIGGTMSNVFIAEAGRLHTPDLAGSGVAGLTRELVMEGAARAGIACCVETIPLERLLEADEVFFVNSLIGVWPVRTLAGRTMAPGKLAARARTWLHEAHDLD